MCVPHFRFAPVTVAINTFLSHQLTGCLFLYMMPFQRHIHMLYTSLVIVYDEDCKSKMIRKRQEVIGSVESRDAIG